MVYVRLEREWTDGVGTTHTAGAMVDVDAATLATLEASGVVAELGGPGDGAEPDGGWPGPTSDPNGPWPGPTGDPDTGGGSSPDGPWPGPTGDPETR